MLDFGERLTFGIEEYVPESVIAVCKTVEIPVNSEIAHLIDSLETVFTVLSFYQVWKSSN